MQNNKTNLEVSVGNSAEEFENANAKAQALLKTVEELKRQLSDALNVKSQANQAVRSVQSSLQKISKSLARFDELDRLKMPASETSSGSGKSSSSKKSSSSSSKKEKGELTAEVPDTMDVFGTLIQEVAGSGVDVQTVFEKLPERFWQAAASADGATEALAILRQVLDETVAESQNMDTATQQTRNRLLGLADAWEGVDIASEDWKNQSAATQAALRDANVPIGKTSAAVGDLQGKLQGLSGSFAGVGTASGSVWEQLKSSWSGSGQWFKDNVANKLIDGANGLISGIVRGINQVLAGVNNIHITIPDWVPSVGGKTLSFGLKTISAPQIPKLATGAVLPANRPFLAMVGDQKHGTNVEAPLETIKQAVAEVMGAYQGGDIAIHFTGDLAQLARVLHPEIRREGRRVGGEMVSREVV